MHVITSCQPTTLYSLKETGSSTVAYSYTEVPSNRYNSDDNPQEQILIEHPNSKIRSVSGTVVYAWNPSTQEAEAGSLCYLTIGL